MNPDSREPAKPAKDEPQVDGNGTEAAPQDAQPENQEYPKHDAKGAFIEIVEDTSGWHWCLWSGNGRMVARNPVPYTSKTAVISAAKSAVSLMKKPLPVLQGTALG